MKAGWRDAPLVLRDSVVSNMHDSIIFEINTLEYVKMQSFIPNKKAIGFGLKKPFFGYFET